MNDGHANEFLYGILIGSSGVIFSLLVFYLKVVIIEQIVKFFKRIFKKDFSKEVIFWKEGDTIITKQHTECLEKWDNHGNCFIKNHKYLISYKDIIKNKSYHERLNDIEINKQKEEMEHYMNGINEMIENLSQNQIVH